MDLMGRTGEESVRTGVNLSGSRLILYAGFFIFIQAIWGLLYTKTVYAEFPARGIVISSIRVPVFLKPGEEIERFLEPGARVNVENYSGGFFRVEINGERGFVDERDLVLECNISGDLSRGACRIQSMKPRSQFDGNVDKEGRFTEPGRSLEDLSAEASVATLLSARGKDRLLTDLAAATGYTVFSGTRGEKIAALLVSEGFKNSRFINGADPLWLKDQLKLSRPVIARVLRKGRGVWSLVLSHYRNEVVFLDTESGIFRTAPLSFFLKDWMKLGGAVVVY